MTVQTYAVAGSLCTSLLFRLMDTAQMSFFVLVYTRLTSADNSRRTIRLFLRNLFQTKAGILLFSRSTSIHSPDTARISGFRARHGARNQNKIHAVFIHPLNCASRRTFAVVVLVITCAYASGVHLPFPALSVKALALSWLHPDTVSAYCLAVRFSLPPAITCATVFLFLRCRYIWFG